MMQSPPLEIIQLLIFFYLLSFFHPTNAQNNDTTPPPSFCDDSPVNYTAVYQKNLNITLNSLAANASLTGFYTTIVGQNSDVVYGLVQCRGDISKDDCQSCAETAAAEIIQLCPNKKRAAIVYDFCLLRYSDMRFFSTASSLEWFGWYNTEDANDSVLFNRQLEYLLGNLSSGAPSNTLRFAFGSIKYTYFTYIYAMMQCTRDLSENSCSSCLQTIIGYIPQCCDKKQGGRVFTVSCSLRFEIYPFSHSPAPPPLELFPPPPSLPTSNSTPGTTSTSPDGKKNTSKTVVIVVIPLAAVALSLMLVICGCFYWRKAKEKSVVIDVVCENGEKSTESLMIGLDTLKVATRNFSEANKLGQGGFGQVYKGKLIDGQEIAVKRMSRNSGQGLAELKTEVVLVAKLLHRNLVKLLGFCLEEEKLLVYEYLPNGSLDKILFDQGRRFSLEWGRRYKIIVGIARGLLYLHEDSQLRIIHRDLKASNILLDENMNPKISDFGLARLFGDSQTQGNTNRIAGTYGYMAPEYVKNGHFSTKSDVYSFGVLVLELVTGRKNSTFRHSVNLQSHAWEHWNNGTALELLDPNLGDQWSRYEVLKCIHIGLLCVQEAAASRPTMSEIVLMLSSYSMTSPVPSQPAFLVLKRSFGSDSAPEDYSPSESGTSKADDSLNHSINEVTITELDPR